VAKGAIAFVTVLLAALILIAAPELLQLPYPPPMQCDNQHRANDQDCRALAVATAVVRRVVDFIDEHANIFIVLGTLAIAWFTFTLWQSTHRLWEASRDQGRDTKDSIAVAGDAASAAKLSAIVAKKALTDLERPHVYVSVVESGVEMPRPGGTASGPAMAHLTRIVIEIANYGRTPAALTEIYWDVDTAESGSGPVVIDPSSTETRKLPVGVIAVDGKSYCESSNMFSRFSVGDRVKIAEGLSSLWCFGFVRYADIFGGRYIVGFNMVYDPLGHRFVIRGDEDRNYSRVEKKPEPESD
jgi:hypothetical protein